jgi:hypothetical protein
MSGGDAALSAAEAGAPATATAKAAPAGTAPADRPGRFRVVARMIMAMKRFEGERFGGCLCGGLFFFARHWVLPASAASPPSDEFFSFRAHFRGSWRPVTLMTRGMKWPTV